MPREVNPQYQDVETPWGVVKQRSKLWSWLPEADDLIRVGGDPGSRVWTLGALCVALIFVPLVVFLQQFTLGLHNQKLSTAPVAVRTSERVDDPGVSRFAVESKLAVKTSHFVQSMGADDATMDDEPPPQPVKRRGGRGGATARDRHQPPRQQPAPAPAPKGKAAPAPKPAPAPATPPKLTEEEQKELDEQLKELDELAVTRTDRLRLVAVVGELFGKAAAVQRLEKLEGELEQESTLRGDVAWFKSIYKKGPGELPAEVRQSLMDRHGWFGALAVSFGLDDSDPTRWNAISGGENVGIFLILYYLFAGLSFLGSLIAALMLFVRHMKGELEPVFEAPLPGGSVYVETFGVFAAAFSFLLLFSLMMFGAGVEGTMGALVFLEIVTWLLVLVPLWPVARGLPWKRVLDDLGWNRGQGVIKEVGCGVAGWLAGIAMSILGGWISGLIDVMSGGGADATEGGTGGYPMFDPPPGNSWFIVILGVASLTLWAPIVEESIFRGALYRFCRGYMRPVWAIAITATLFGIYHPYGVGGIVSVALAGLVFGYLREWRGSLIAPVVAHALHNGTIALYSVGLVAAAG